MVAYFGDQKSFCVILDEFSMWPLQNLHVESIIYFRFRRKRRPLRIE